MTGSGLSSKWEAIRKCVKEETSYELEKVQDSTTLHEKEVDTNINNRARSEEEADEIVTTRRASRAKKLKKNVRKYVISRTLYLYARSKLRLAADGSNRN